MAETRLSVTDFSFACGLLVCHLEIARIVFGNAAGAGFFLSHGSYNLASPGGSHFCIWIFGCKPSTAEIAARALRFWRFGGRRRTNGSLSRRAMAGMIVSA